MFDNKKIVTKFFKDISSICERESDKGVFNYLSIFMEKIKKLSLTSDQIDFFIEELFLFEKKKIKERDHFLYKFLYELNMFFFRKHEKNNKLLTNAIKDGVLAIDYFRDKIVTFNKEEKELIWYYYKEVSVLLENYGTFFDIVKEINDKEKKIQLIDIWLKHSEILVHAEQYILAQNKLEKMERFLESIKQEKEYSLLNEKRSQLLSNIKEGILFVKNNILDEVLKMSKSMELLFEQQRFDGVFDVFLYFSDKRKSFIDSPFLLEKLYEAIQNIEKHIIIPISYKEKLENNDPRIWKLFYNLYTAYVAFWVDLETINPDHLKKILITGRAMMISYEKELRDLPKYRKSTIVRFYNGISAIMNDFIPFLEAMEKIKFGKEAKIIKIEMYLLQVRICIIAEELEIAKKGLEYEENQIALLKEEPGYLYLLKCIKITKEYFSKSSLKLSTSIKDEQFVRNSKEIEVRLERDYFNLLYFYGKEKNKEITTRKSDTLQESIKASEKLLLDIESLVYQDFYIFERMCKLKELLESAKPLIPKEKSIEEILKEIGEPLQKNPPILNKGGKEKRCKEKQKSIAIKTHKPLEDVCDIVSCKKAGLQEVAVAEPCVKESVLTKEMILEQAYSLKILEMEELLDSVISSEKQYLPCKSSMN